MPDAARPDPTPSRTLRGEEILRDPLIRELVESRLIAILSTLEPDGSIHGVPLWYAADGETIVFATGSKSRKVRNLCRDPRATVVLHDSRPGMEICGASIRGTVEIVDGEAAVPTSSRSTAATSPTPPCASPRRSSSSSSTTSPSASTRTPRSPGTSVEAPLPQPSVPPAERSHSSRRRRGRRRSSLREKSICRHFANLRGRQLAEKPAHSEIRSNGDPTQYY